MPPRPDPQYEALLKKVEELQAQVDLKNSSPMTRHMKSIFSNEQIQQKILDVAQLQVQDPTKDDVINRNRAWQDAQQAVEGDFRSFMAMNVHYERHAPRFHVFLHNYVEKKATDRNIFSNKNAQLQFVSHVWDKLTSMEGELRVAATDYSHWVKACTSADVQWLPGQVFWPLFDAFCVALKFARFTAPSIGAVPRNASQANVKERLQLLIQAHGESGTKLAYQAAVVSQVCEQLTSLNGTVPYLNAFDKQSCEHAFTQLERVVQTLPTRGTPSAYQNQGRPKNTRTASRGGTPPRQARGGTRGRGSRGGAVQVNAIAEEGVEENKINFDYPLLTLDGVVNACHTRAHLDLGAQPHVITKKHAAKLGLPMVPTTAKAVSVTGQPLKIVGVVRALQWSAAGHASKDDESQVTRLQLSNVLVSNSPMRYPLLIGLGALYGVNPHELWLQNKPNGFFVTFKGHAPLKCVRHPRKVVQDSAATNAKMRLQTKEICALLEKTPTISVLAPDAALGLYGHLDLLPAVRRDEQPKPRTNIAGIRYANESIATSVRKALAKKSPEVWVDDDSTPRVIPGLVYLPLIRADANFDGLEQKQRRISKEKTDAQAKEAARLLQARGARLSEQSPFLAQVHPVEKKDEFAVKTGKFRHVANYQLANNVLMPDKHPLRRIDELLDWVARGKAFTILDLSRAFEQVAMDIRATAITRAQYGPGLVLERLTGPFGLKGLPSCLQRFMDKLLHPFEHAQAYLDDLIVRHMSDDPKEIAKDVAEIVTALGDAGVAIKASKVRIGFPEAILVGHHVSHNAITPQYDRIAAWTEAKLPKTVTELRGFLATLNMFSRHFAAMAQHNSTLRKLEVATKSGPLKWTPEAIREFESLKQYVADHCVFGGRATIAPIEWDTPLLLATDWAQRDATRSGGVGWVLYTVQNDERKIISCGSRSLPKGNIYDLAMRGELYALQAALQRDGFAIRGRECQWICDCKPLVEAWKKGSTQSYTLQKMLTTLTSEWPDLTPHHVDRGENEVADYFSIIATEAVNQSSTTENALVAGLEQILEHNTQRNEYLVRTAPDSEPKWVSARTARAEDRQMVQQFLRAERPIITIPREQIEQAAVRAQSQHNAPSALSSAAVPAQSTSASNDARRELDELLQIGERPIYEPSVEDEDEIDNHNLPSPTAIAQFRAAISHAQQMDESIEFLYQAANGTMSANDFERLTATQRACIESLQPQMHQNLLVAKPLTSVNPPRIIMPARARPNLLMSEHERSGHFSGAANLAAIERAFWWPGMRADVFAVAQSCRTCQEARQHNKSRRIGAPTLAGAPMDTAMADLQFNNEMKWLTILDLATRYIWVEPLPDKKAATVFRAFLRATRPFGRFNKIIVDQGREFDGDFTAQLQRLGTTVIDSAPDNPNAHGAVERVQRDNLAVAAKILQEHPRMSQRDLTNEVSSAHNFAVRSDAKVSPFECMFGRPPPLPAEAHALLTPHDMAKAMAVYNKITDIPDNMSLAVAALQTAIATQNEKRASNNQKKAEGEKKFAIGDFVLYRGREGNTKFEARIPYMGPFQVSNVMSDGHSLQLSWQGNVVEEKVATRNCVHFQNPKQTRVFIQAGQDESEWINSPFHSPKTYWLDDDLLRYAHRHRFAVDRALAT